MSHLLHVWEVPRPASVADAVAIRGRLQREGAAPSPRFALLAARLTARHPDIDASDDDDADPGVWTDGPLAANGRGPVFGIGIQAHAAEAVVPFVVATARALGLVVLDEESGLVFLPDGRVLGQRPSVAAPPPPPPPDRALTRAEVLQALHRALGPRLVAAGFGPAEGDADYQRAMPAARVVVKFDCESRAPEHQVSVHTSLVVPGTQPLALVQLLAPRPHIVTVRDHELAAAAGIVWPRTAPTHGSPAIIETPDELQGLCAHWQQRLEAVLLPLVERCRDLRGLEQVLREQPDAFGPQRVSLALSAACGRTDLGAMAQRLIDRSNSNWHDDTREWLAFLQSPPSVDLGPPLQDAAAAMQALPLLREGRPVLPAGPEGLGPAFAEQPVTSRFVGTRYVVYGVDQGGTTAHVQQRHLAALPCTPAQLHAQALANLAARADSGWRLQAEGPLQRLHLDGRHDAGLLLLDALWQGPLAAQMPGGALAAIPADDELLCCDVAAPGGLAALRARIAQRQAAGAALLSQAVFYRRDGRWEALPPPRGAG